MSDDTELSEVEYLEALIDDFELTPENTIKELLDALREDEADEGEEV